MRIIPTKTQAKTDLRGKDASRPCSLGVIHPADPDGHSRGRHDRLSLDSANIGLWAQSGLQPVFVELTN